jgi:hypothetical protein
MLEQLCIGGRKLTVDTRVLGLFFTCFLSLLPLSFRLRISLIYCVRSAISCLISALHLTGGSLGCVFITLGGGGAK